MTMNDMTLDSAYTLRDAVDTIRLNYSQMDMAGTHDGWCVGSHALMAGMIVPAMNEGQLDEAYLDSLVTFANHLIEYLR